MKTKLDPQEKARRASWRQERHSMPSVPRKHHLTKKERMPSGTLITPPATGNLTAAAAKREWELERIIRKTSFQEEE